jgi:catechol 2,3-dioxygenase-like lactoylglutathione lyase family enzyme
MICRLRTNSLLIVPLVFAASIIAGCCTEPAKTKDDSAAFAGRKNRIRLEHVAINVEDSVAMAKWYCENLGMKIIRKGEPPANMRFISDAGGNMMLEIYHNPPDAVPDYSSMDPLLLHIAFMVDDVKAICDKLLTAGATVAGDVNITPAGDEIAMLRDPWGVPIQFVKRAEPMLPHK